MSQRAVMVVEDEESQRVSLTEFLAWKGYWVNAFPSGRDAVDWLDSPSARIDAAVVDWHLPGVGGEGVVDAIRRLDARLPIIVASGSPLSAAERRRGQWSCALRKPFSLRKLSDLLGELLEK